MNIKHPCKKVELRARFVVVITKLVPDSPYRRLIAEYLSFQTAVPKKCGEGMVEWTRAILLGDPRRQRRQRQQRTIMCAAFAWEH